jgi:hypothetical protein
MSDRELKLVVNVPRCKQVVTRLFIMDAEVPVRCSRCGLETTNYQIQESSFPVGHPMRDEPLIVCGDEQSCEADRLEVKQYGRLRTADELRNAHVMANIFGWGTVAATVGCVWLCSIAGWVGLIPLAFFGFHAIQYYNYSREPAVTRRRWRQLRAKKRAEGNAVVTAK